MNQKALPQTASDKLLCTNGSARVIVVRLLVYAFSAPHMCRSEFAPHRFASFVVGVDLLDVSAFVVR